MRIVIIGGSGFIGTRLISTLLESGHEVVNLDLQPSAAHPDLTVLGDVRVQADVVSAVRGSDVIVNLAAEHRDDVRPASRYDEVNVGGARVVVAAAEEAGVERIVFTSSVAVYGLGVTRPTEQAPTRPFNDYGRTKLEAEAVLRAWAAASPTRTLLVVRPCVVFGEANRGNVYTLTRQVASGRFLFIGTGRNAKSMAYVGNIAAFLAHLATDAHAAGTTTVNYADSPDLTTRELVERIQRELHLPASRRSLPRPVGLAAGAALDVVARLTGRTFPISRVRVEKFVAETTVDTSALKRCGFTPPHTIEEGLVRTLHAEFPELARASRRGTRSSWRAGAAPACGPTPSPGCPSSSCPCSPAGPSSTSPSSGRARWCRPSRCGSAPGSSCARRCPGSRASPPTG
jgi:nucleoside-diphosphate-sugar epimerase